MRAVRFLVSGLLLGAMLLPAALLWLDAARTVTGRRHAYRDFGRRVVVLGFDGVDPGILDEYLDRLPALRELATHGTLLPCRTTNPPESPVAWATFATGLNPGEHGIFDFVRRDPKSEDSYRPRNGMVDRRRPVIGVLGFPIRPPAAINRLARHSWPGNVRELANTLTRAALWSCGSSVTEGDVEEALLDLPLEEATDAGILARSVEAGIDLQGLLDHVTRHYLRRALEFTGGNKKRAAKLLGLPSYQTLTNWLKKYGLSN